MYYVIQIKPEETIVRNIYRNEDDADDRCFDLSERWPHALFDVVNERELDTYSNVKC